MVSRNGAVAPGSADPSATPAVSSTDVMLLGMSILGCDAVPVR